MVYLCFVDGMLFSATDLILFCFAMGEIHVCGVAGCERDCPCKKVEKWLFSNDLCMNV